MTDEKKKELFDKDLVTGADIGRLCVPDEWVPVDRIPRFWSFYERNKKVLKKKGYVLKKESIGVWFISLNPVTIK